MLRLEEASDFASLNANIGAGDSNDQVVLVQSIAFFFGLQWPVKIIQQVDCGMLS